MLQAICMSGRAAESSGSGVCGDLRLFVISVAAAVMGSCSLEVFAAQVLDLAVQQEILTRGQEESIIKLARGEREQPAGAPWEGVCSLAPSGNGCTLVPACIFSYGSNSEAWQPAACPEVHLYGAPVSQGVYDTFMLLLRAVVRPAGQRTMSFIKIDYSKEKRHAVDAAGGAQGLPYRSSPCLFPGRTLQLGASFFKKRITLQHPVMK
jgi:hypothetical protein